MENISKQITGYTYDGDEIISLTLNGKTYSPEPKLSVPKLLEADFEDILVYAERYALGRQSMAPLIYTDFIERYLKDLSLRTLINLQRDIETAPSYGDDNVDKPLWMELLSAINEEIAVKKSKIAENI